MVKRLIDELYDFEDEEDDLFGDELEDDEDEDYFFFDEDKKTSRRKGENYNESDNFYRRNSRRNIPG